VRFLSLASGWKTYIVCAIGVLTGVAQGLDATHVIAFHIPGFVDWVLVFLGGASLRHGVQTRSAQITEEVVGLVQLILANVTAKDTPVPSPAGQTEAQERAETASLNKAQL